MSVSLLLSALQPVVIAPPAPPPPPIMISNSMPAPPVIAMPTGSPYNRPTITVRVRAFAGRTVLLQDEFRVGRSAAMYNLNRSEALELACNAGYGSSARSSVSFGIRPDMPAEDGYRVSFGWTRPSIGCASEGTMTVNFDRAVILRPGQSVTVEGDGGVRVELTRL